LHVQNIYKYININWIEFTLTCEAKIFSIEVLKMCQILVLDKKILNMSIFEDINGHSLLNIFSI